MGVRQSEREDKRVLEAILECSPYSFSTVCRAQERTHSPNAIHYTPHTVGSQYSDVINPHLLFRTRRGLIPGWASDCVLSSLSYCCDTV
jgi:hypothetical protein